MQTFHIQKGATSVILPISIFDSSSTTGAKLAGLVFNSAGLTAYYNRSGAAGVATAITLATATKGTWATGGFIAIDGTNMPGDYELHIPDAALATGANSVLVQLKGATNLVPKNVLIELFDVNLRDGVRAGMTALPNAAAGATGGLAVVDASGAVKLQSGTAANQISLSSGAVLLQATQTGVTIPTVTTLTGHTAQTGDNFARLGAPAGASVSADVAAVKVDTAAILVDTGTTLDGRIPVALVGGRMDSNASAIAGDATAASNLSKSASVVYRGSVTGAATTTTLIDSVLTQAGIDHWKGRIIIFTSGTLKYQATDITAFDPATDKLTFTALTGVPASADEYVIV